MSLFNELKRRNVFRVGIAYAVVAWLVVQVADVMIDNLGAPDWLFGAILMVLGLGFPVVLVFAWAFELTPEGLKRESEVDRSQSITPQTGRKLDRMIIGVLVLAVAYLLIDKLVLQKEMGSEPFSQETTRQTTQAGDEKRGLTPADTSPAGPSVAVLPFVNMSSDAEQEYFSDGLTETLLHMLAQLPDLRVAARTSSFAFKGQNKSIGEIAQTLGVAHVLEGSVQKAGDRIRVTAQLIRAADGFHVWSENYTRPLEDIFAIQDEIATDVAEALDASLLSGEGHMHSVETGNLTAYDLYLKAMEQQSIFSYGSLGEAESAFKQALSEDPDFVDAKLGLVRNYLMMYNTGLIEREALYRQAEPLLAQVKELQPDNRLAQALGMMLEISRPEAFIDPTRREQIIYGLRNVLPLIPTESFIREFVANVLWGLQQKPEEALDVVQAGLMIDPLSPELHAARGTVLREMDRLDEAKAALERAVELDPRNPNTYSDLSRIAARQGDLRGKLNYYRMASEVDPQDHELAAFLAEQLYQLRLPEEGDRWARKVAALAPGSDVARRIELLRASALGEEERTLEVARSMLEDEVGDRGGAYGTALGIYSRLMAESGHSEEAVHYLQSLDPELLDFDKPFERFEPVIRQWSAIVLMNDFRPTDEVRAEWAAFTEKLDTTGIPWRERSETNQAWDLLMRGEIDQAAQFLLDKELSKPLATWPERFRNFQSPQWHELAERTDIAARLNELESEYQLARTDIRQMLLEPDWNQ